MSNIYRVERKTEGGSWKPEIPTFTTKKEALSFASNWVREQKYSHRCKNGQNDRDYGELKAIVYGAKDYGDDCGPDFFCKIYQ